MSTVEDTVAERLSEEIEIDVGHRIPDPDSRCKHPHGHRYRIVVHCEEQRPSTGTVRMNVAADIKTVLIEYVGEALDHGFIVYKFDNELLNAFWPHLHNNDPAPIWKVVIFPYIPTAENIAQWVWERIQPHFNWETSITGLKLYEVEVWETPTICARYSG